VYGRTLFQDEWDQAACAPHVKQVFSFSSPDIILLHAAKNPMLKENDDLIEGMPGLVFTRERLMHVGLYVHPDHSSQRNRQHSTTFWPGQSSAEENIILVLDGR
jgi:hypothetical protein